eukprot:TRINITY_DN451_c0_g1_i1.p1 TRINITY_DN451_c0_g1~~TRINITY_DN451_c0_g1_i1.p1  ORF type:complete len:406 (+),score=65.25 TRINITY_DN451_c0_g1_i1:52-1269(+)
MTEQHEVKNMDESTEPKTEEKQDKQTTQEESKPETKKKKIRVMNWEKYSIRHVALKLAYLGWRYCGFAIQREEPTVEAELFKALQHTKLVQDLSNSNYARCGRTDKGVNAFGQVVSLLMRSNLSSGVGVIKVGTESKPNVNEIDYISTLNKTLPPDIRVIAWAPAPTDFNARFSCISRTYKYIFFQETMDMQVLTKAAEQFIGFHDFRHFCRMDLHNVSNFERTVLSIEIEPIQDDKPLSDPFKLYQITICGKGFLWHQIRCMMAILFLIGKGLEKPEIIPDLFDIEKYPRKPTYEMASEVPLILYDCTFENLKFEVREDIRNTLVDHFTRSWRELTLKTGVVRTMLDSLDKTWQSKPEVKPKRYTQLKKRTREKSLEERTRVLKKNKTDFGKNDPRERNKDEFE